MKKMITIVIVVLTLLAPAAVFGQSLWFLSSLQSDWSGELFDNELGAALTPVERTSGPNLIDLNRFYLFAGTANLQRVTNTGGMTGNLGNPLLFGVFVPGDMPYSFFSGLHVVGGDDDAFEVDTVTQTVPVADGDDTTNHQWVSQRTTTDRRVPSLEDVNLQLQYLTRFGGITGGAFLMWSREDLRTHVVATGEVFANTAGAGEVPDPVLTSRVTSTTDDRGGTENEIAAAFPLFLRTGELGHAITPNLGFTTVNSSASAEQSVTFGGDDPVGPQNEGTAMTTDVTRTVNAGAMYELLMPGMFGDHERNQISVGGSFGMTLTSRNRGFETESETLSYDGTETNVDSATDGTQTYEYDGGFGFFVSAFAGQTFYHDLPNNVTFSYGPRLWIGFDQDAPAPRETRTEMTQLVTDAAGDPTTDQVITTTFEYANRDSERSITTTFSLPVAIKAQPEGWLFGFTLSGTPTMSYSVDIDTTYSQTLSRQTVHSVDDVAETDATVTTEYADDGYTRNVDHSWAFGANYEFGIHVPLAENVQLDIGLSGAAGNLLNFNAMTVQAIIGL